MIQRLPSRGVRIICLCLFLACPSASRAMWIPVQTSQVPVDRVLTNLTKRLERATNNLELLHVIARLHSMAYAAGGTNFTVQVATNGMPFFGHGTIPSPPDKVIHLVDTNASAIANAHLREAIRYYNRVLALATNSPVPFLGIGWCQLQKNDTNNARASLRTAVKLAWSQESRQQFLWASITAEAIKYLLPLLDPQEDRTEISNLKDLETQSVAKTGRMMTPLVLPLSAALRLPDLVNTNASVAFDLDGSGLPDRKWQWITTNAAWIVHLPQGGPVTSALQMFGNVTFWMFWENGYHALASLDDNGDGLLSGQELRGIRLWQDRNSDGECTPDEILELSDLGITALDTRYQTENGILTAQSGARFSDNSTRPTYDLILRRR